MLWSKWYRHGRKRDFWLLEVRSRRARRIAVVQFTPQGWIVYISRYDQAGPYGNFDVARQAAAIRIQRNQSYE